MLETRQEVLPAGQREIKEGIPDAVVVDEEGNIEIDHTSMDVRLSRTVSSVDAST